MSMSGPLRMVGGVFHAFNSGTFEGLVSVRQFLDAFFIRLGYFGKSLRTAGLPSTPSCYLGGVIAEFVQLGLVILRKKRVSFHS